MTDSSSSSNYYEEEQQELLPFSFRISESNKSNGFSFYKEKCFFCLDNEKSVLISENRYMWEKFFETEDLEVKSTIVFGDYLFVATSPKGLIYKINLNDQSYKQIQILNCPAHSFFELKGSLYIVCSNPSSVFKYDPSIEIFDPIYMFAGEIRDVVVAQEKAYFATKSSNQVLFDGKEFTPISKFKTNIWSIRKIKQDPFSTISYSFVNRSELVDNYNSNREILMDVFPYRRTTGCNCVAYSNNIIFWGAENSGRIIQYDTSTDKYEYIFDSEEKSVYAIYMVDHDKMLTSIGDKVYFGYKGTLSMKPDQESEDEKTDSIKTKEKSQNYNKKIKITSPIGGSFEYGNEIPIRWVSSESINDVVSIDLYKNDSKFISIIAQTNNDGVYDWLIPGTIPQGDYNIGIERLISGELDENNIDITSETVEIVEEIRESKYENEVEKEKTEKWYFIPILHLHKEHVTTIKYDSYYGNILFGTSNGRILSSSNIDKNAYGTGEAKIYARAYNEYGFSSRIEQTNMLYSLHNRIAEISENSSINHSIFVKKASIGEQNTLGVFVSKIIVADQDFGFWENIIWEETGNSVITVFVRTADSIESINNEAWSVGFKKSEGESSPFNRSLLETRNNGRYAQIKIEINNIDNVESGKVSSATISYSSKKASYFFTNTFYLENGSDINKGILTAKINQPINTEVLFGITNKESSQWEDYEIISKNEFFNIGDINKIKLGIKFVTYDNSIPDVSEFALITAGSKINKVNSEVD